MPPLRREEPRRVDRRIVGLVAVLALVLATAVVGGIVLSAREDDRAAGAAVAAPVERDPLLRGVPQDGLVLGRPDAPVTVVEYADLQCPYCAQWSRDAFPKVVEEYVRTGKVRIVFRGLAFLGPDSETALRAALAAGEQDRLWDVVHGLYARQGAENAGWVTQDLLRGFAGLVDAERMLADSGSPGVEREIVAAQSAARAAGVPGTPYFQAGRTGGMLALRLGGLDAASFAAELDRLLAA